MDTITTAQPSRGLIDSHVLTTGKAEAFFDGRIDKERIYVKGINYDFTDTEIKTDLFLAIITIKTKLKTSKTYARAFDKRLNTISVTQEDIVKDSFASKKLNVIAEKINFTEPQELQIQLKPKIKGKVVSDKSSIVFSGKLCAQLTVGVGLCVNTDGVIAFSKNKLKISNATKVEIFIKATTGYNPLSKIIELDVDKVLENTRGQMYLLESELYDVVKMKHLMDIDKETILD